MRTVVSSREVVHLWAHQVQDHARNSSRSVSFNGPSLYSYRAEIARIVDAPTGKVALHSSHRWSITTARHQLDARRAIPGSVVSFAVPNLGTSASYHAANLAYFREQREASLGRAQRARIYGDSYRAQAATMAQRAGRYCEVFTLSSEDSVVAQVVAEAAEARALLAANEARYAEEARQEAARVDAELADSVTLWRQGGSVNISRYSRILLRLSADGESVETSRGAFVPLDHAQRLYGLVVARSVKFGDKCGHYRVDRVGESTLTLGCHEIDRAEIDRLAESFGWPMPLDNVAAA